MFVQCSVIISVKSSIHLHYPNQEYRAFSEIDSSDDVTCIVFLEYYVSDVVVSKGFTAETAHDRALGKQWIAQKSSHGLSPLFG